MRSLDKLETQQISGALTAAETQTLNNLANFSFYSAVIGGAISGAYALATNTTTETISRNARGGMTGSYMSSSFPSVFFIGLGISWIVGLSVGLGVSALQLADK